MSLSLAFTTLTNRSAFRATIFALTKNMAKRVYAGQTSLRQTAIGLSFGMATEVYT